MKIFVIPDIHGRYDLLVKALELIQLRADTGKIVFLGDYVSRGPDSAKILKELRFGSTPGFERVVLKGNHESFFSDTDMMAVDKKTRRSMEKEKIWKDRHSYAKWCRKLPMYHIDQGFIFAHADWDEKLFEYEQTEEILLWRRRPPHWGFHLEGYTLIHGHTPDVNGPVFTPNRINLDTKAHATGTLHFAELEAGNKPRIWKVSA